jgi:hypothetical protein
MRIFLALAIIFICVRCAGQSVISTAKHNVLISGIPNELSIGLKGVQADSVELRCEKCSFEKLDMWYWRVTPDTSLRVARIILRAWSNTKLVVIDTLSFRVKWLPDPVIYVANKTGQNDSVLRPMLLSADGVFARGENIDEDVWFRVQSYRMTLSNDTNTHYIENSGHINPEMKIAVANAPPGTIVTFDNVMVLYPDTQIRMVRGVRFKIK